MAALMHVLIAYSNALEYTKNCFFTRFNFIVWQVLVELVSEAQVRVSIQNSESHIQTVRILQYSKFGISIHRNRQHETAPSWTATP